jgi:septum formation protein
VLILASASPRRHELLLAAGLDHIVLPASVPELIRPGETPTSLVQRLAEEKARATPKSASDIVLGADTVVCVDDQILGKPRNDREATVMLRTLSGREHWVFTGICLLSNRKSVVDLARTSVLFAELTEEEIEEYVRSDEPRDKAGAYAIQGLASKFVLSIKGCYQNVVGLPVSLVYHHLKYLD